MSTGRVRARLLNLNLEPSTLYSTERWHLAPTASVLGGDARQWC